MATVSINPPKTPVTQGSTGIAAATLPNICKMPGPPAPFVPTPLPNIGKSGDAPQGYSTTVKIEGNTVAIKGATFGSVGDIASKGLGGGIVSLNTHGPTKFVGPGSMNVKIEGKNVQLLGDPMLNNCGPSGSPANAATMTGVVQPPSSADDIQPEDSEPCKEAKKQKAEKCGAIPQLMKGKKVIHNLNNVKMTSHLTKDELDARLNGFDECLEARQAVTKECFGGVTDERHAVQEGQLASGKEATQALKERLFGK